MSDIVERQAGRAIFAVGLVFALVLSAMFINGANATATFELARYEGADRYLTGKEIAEKTYPTGTAKAIIASGTAYPDALAAAFLAGNLAGPVLLTLPGSVPAATKNALTTLKVKDVTIVGGTGAVSAAVEAHLKTLDSTNSSGGKLNVTRIEGTDRYESASKIATAAGTTVGTVAAKKTAIVARGDDFPDALAGGPLGYAGKLPVLLTEGAPAPTVNGKTKAALNTLGIEQVLILGGTGAITTETETEIKNARGAGSITTVRLQGSSRTETARAIAEYALASMSFVNTHADVARGDGFADALAGAAHGGVTKSPILLTVSNVRLSPSSSTGARKYLTDHASTLAAGHIFGGTGAVSATVEQEAETAGRSVASPSPSGSATNTASPSPSPSPSPSVAPGAPTVLDVRAVDGTGSVLTAADAGDYIQFVFNKPMSATTAAVGSWFKLKDTDQTERTYTCGTQVNCVLQLAGTFDECVPATCAADQVMRVKIVSTPTGGAEGSIPTMAYLSAQLSGVSADWKDAAGTALNFAGSPDKAVSTQAMTPAPSTTAQVPSSAARVGTTQTVRLTYPVRMTCYRTGPSQVTVAGTPDKVANALVCDRTTGIDATFPASSLVAGAATVRYTPSATQADRFMDLDGNFAAQSSTDYTST